MKNHDLIAIVGPESTGKTTLAQQLAQRLSGVWLPEYSRTFLTDTEYDRRNLLSITREQLQREIDFVRSRPSIGVLDTDGIVLQVWWEELFNEVPSELTDHLDSQPRRVYLLMRPDLPWEPDPLRESQFSLDSLFSRYQETLTKYGYACSIVEGLGQDRANYALHRLQELDISQP